MARQMSRQMDPMVVMLLLLGWWGFADITLSVRTRRCFSYWRIAKVRDVLERLISLWLQLPHQNRC